MVRTQTFE